MSSSFKLAPEYEYEMKLMWHSIEYEKKVVIIDNERETLYSILGSFDIDNYKEIVSLIVELKKYRDYCNQMMTKYIREEKTIDGCIKILATFYEEQFEGINSRIKSLQHRLKFIMNMESEKMKY